MIKAVKKVEFARLVGMRKQSINDAARRTILKDAVLPNGDIDLNHAAAKEYLKKNSLKIKLKMAAEAVEAEGLSAEEIVEGRINSASFSKHLKDGAVEWLEEIDAKNNTQKFLDMSLKNIVENFGGNPAFTEWLKTVKILEEIKEKQIKNEEAAGNLIPRDFVKQHIIALIDATNARLLNDAPRSITARILEEIGGGAGKEEIETVVRDLISTQLKNLKLKARRALEK